MIIEGGNEGILPAFKRKRNNSATKSAVILLVQGLGFALPEHQVTSDRVCTIPHAEVFGGELCAPRELKERVPLAEYREWSDHSDLRLCHTSWRRGEGTFRLHNFRHALSTALVKLKVDAATTAQGMLRHKDFGTTMTLHTI